MLDIRLLAQDPESFAARLARRGKGIDLEPVFALDRRRRELIQRTDELRHRKGKAEEAMKTADKKSPEFTTFRDEMRTLANEIKVLEESLKVVEAELDERALYLPNLPDDAVPDGASADDNAVIRTWGEKPVFDFEPLEHDRLGEKMGILDFERAVKITGARFTVYRGGAARLERALINFMLEQHTTAHGYTEILPPFMVNATSMQGTGQFPKFREEAFEMEKDGFYLVPTAEVPVTNLHRDEILDARRLPVRYAAYTPCFRREAGSYGKDTRGLIRQHQFNKVELVQFTTPEDSARAHEELTGHAERILQLLGLHYRVVDLCAGDLGNSAARTYDLEVWLPGQNAYREISSCSNFRDFQSRRAAIRYRPEAGRKPQLVHTLNGSGLAIGRTVVALLENYQTADGRVRIPEALRPFLRGDAFIEPESTEIG
jgi:seryl-tRNA synthetase